MFWSVHKWIILFLRYTKHFGKNIDCIEFMISDIPNSDYDGFFLLSKAFCYLSLGIKKSTTAHHSWWNAGWNGINLSIFYSRSWCKTFSILVGYDNVSESQGHNRWRNLWGAKKMQLICLCTNKINYASLLKSNLVLLSALQWWHFY